MCHSTCTTCLATPTNCTTCTKINLITLIYLFNSTCRAVCPNGTYPDSLNSSNNVCSQCNANCSTCLGPTLNNCTGCQNYTNGTMTTIYYKDLNSNTCGLSCPAGQFVNISLPNRCNYCNINCSICASSANICSACIMGYFLN